MSVQSIQNQIKNIQREIESFQRRLTEKTKSESTKTNRIVQIKKSINKNTSVSTLQSKSREISRLENDIAKLNKEKADLTKKISDKTTMLYKKQNDLFKEQQKEQKKFQDSITQSTEAARQSHRNYLSNIQSDSQTSQAGKILNIADQEYDAFISHAHEDKETLVEPLAKALVEKGLKIWHDKHELTVGDSLRRSIDAGLAKSKFGIVVLSPAFLLKNWPQYELDGLVEKEMEGEKVILPIWHKISKNELLNYSPSLADKLALNTAMYTIEEIAKELSNAIKRA